MSVRQNGVIIAGSGSGSVDIDNSTITKNSIDEIQASAVINQNSGIVKTWKGTLAQYNALAIHATDTVYVITDDQALDIIPSGMIMPYAGTTIPQGYLLCDGSAVSRTTYANLFTAIGTTYGAGDGNTTFNLPNSNDRVLQGNGTRGIVGTQLNESLPNIKGGFGYNIITEGSVPGSGAISTYAGGYNAGTYGANYTMRSFSFRASFYSGVYQDNAPVQQNALCVNYIIKY